MTINKTITALTLGVLTSIIVACDPTPTELADRYRDAKARLESETDSAKRVAIRREIIDIENSARNTFSTDDFKKYARLAHPADEMSADEATDK